MRSSTVWSATWSLQPDEIIEFKRLAQPLQVGSGHVIFHEGDSSDSSYLIEAGHVKLYRSTSEGKVSTMSIRTAGDLFGMGGVLKAESRRASAESIEGSILWRMNDKTFMALLNSKPQIAIRVATMLATHLHYAELTILNLTYLEVESRLARLLLHLAGIDSKPAEKRISVDIKLTHQEIANMIGTCRQTVTTVLKQFKEAEIINVGKQHIEIIDSRALEGFSKSTGR
jgi:CRP-like cAMP-binding protein